MDEYRLVTEVSRDGYGTYTHSLEYNGQKVVTSPSKPFGKIIDEISQNSVKHIANSLGKIKKLEIIISGEKLE